MARKSLVGELSTRKVVQVSAVYVVVACGAIEILLTIAERTFVPQWVSTVAVVGFVLGFPVSIFLAWTFNLTPDGRRRTTVGSHRGKASIALSTVSLVVATAGVFFLIKSSLDDVSTVSGQPSVPPNSVAVLPNDFTGNDPRESHRVEGLSDALRDQLVRMSMLRIAARSSSVAASLEGIAARPLSARLGIAKLVEGSMEHQGDLLRVAVQLVEGGIGRALWSETYSRSPREFLSI